MVRCEGSGARRAVLFGAGPAARYPADMRSQGLAPARLSPPTLAGW